METQLPEAVAFQAFLANRLANGGRDQSVEELVNAFRSYQRELDSCRHEIQPALDRLDRGEGQELDVDQLKMQVATDLAQEGIAE